MYFNALDTSRTMSSIRAEPCPSQYSTIKRNTTIIATTIDVFVVDDKDNNDNNDNVDDDNVCNVSTLAHADDKGRSGVDKNGNSAAIIIDVVTTNDEDHHDNEWKLLQLLPLELTFFVQLFVVFLLFESRSADSGNHRSLLLLPKKYPPE